MKYSICVATYKDLVPTMRMLASLLRLPPGGEFEVLICADSLDAGDQATLGGLTETPQIVIAAHLDRSVPFAIKQNLNISMAHGDYIICCDDDIEFIHERWADEMREVLEAHPELAAVAACTPDRTTRKGKQQVAQDHDPAAHCGEFRSGRLFSGFCWMASRRVFDWGASDYVGFLDTFHRSQLDDADWCCRARQYGHSVAVCYGAMVRHHKRENRTGNSYPQARANYRKKWGAPALEDLDND